MGLDRSTAPKRIPDESKSTSSNAVYNAATKKVDSWPIIFQSWSEHNEKYNGVPIDAESITKKNREHIIEKVKSLVNHDGDLQVTDLTPDVIEELSPFLVQPHPQGWMKSIGIFAHNATTPSTIKTSPFLGEYIFGSGTPKDMVQRRRQYYSGITSPFTSKYPAIKTEKLSPYQKAMFRPTPKSNPNANAKMDEQETEDIQDWIMRHEVKQIENNMMNQVPKSKEDLAVIPKSLFFGEDTSFVLVDDGDPESEFYNIVLTSSEKRLIEEDEKADINKRRTMMFNGKPLRWAKKGTDGRAFLDAQYNEQPVQALLSAKEDKTQKYASNFKSNLSKILGEENITQSDDMLDLKMTSNAKALAKEVGGFTGFNITANGNMIPAGNAKMFVVDGDTIRVNYNFIKKKKPEYYRFKFVDTPESEDNDHGKKTPGGVEAKESLIKFFANGGAINLITSGQDKYKRFLTEATYNGKSVAEHIVENGYSLYMVTFDPAGKPLHNALIKAEDVAKKEKRGLYTKEPEYLKKQQEDNEEAVLKRMGDK